MDALLKKAQDFFKFSMDEYESSRAEAKEIRDFNHNKHYTISQLNVLRNRKQPEETFNVIKSYKRVLSGYLASTINNINVKATHPRYTNKATVGNDIVQQVLRTNNFDMFRNSTQDGIILSGLTGYELDIVKVGEDSLGTPDTEIRFRPLMENELAIDPLYKNQDYSDGRFIATFHWIPKESLKNIYPRKVEELDNYYIYEGLNNFNTNRKTFTGKYKMYDNYLVVKMQLKDGGKIWELLFVGDILLEKTDITHIGRFTMRPFTMEKTEDAEYYGLFREVLESQKAINQALIQIQLLANTNKIFIRENSVKDINTFKKQFDRVNAVIQIKDLSDYKIENMSGDVIAQYNIISNALDRIKQVLNLNDSFLGMQGSSASGRQVKLQQNMTASALNYLTSKINFIYTKLAEDILSLAKIYYKANKIIRVTDDINGDKYVEINKPITINGEVQFKDEINYTEDGKAVLKPWIDRDTMIDDLEYEVEITTSNYNETDDMERVQLDAIIQGPAGQMLLQADPASYAKVVAIQTKGMKTRNSEYIAKVFEDVANKLSGAPTQDPREGNTSQQSGGTAAGSIMSAAGMTNDAQPAGYNQPKG